MPDELAIDVPGGGESYYTAFWWLHRRRKYASGMVTAPLALDASEISAYAAALGLEVEEAMYFVDLMDAEWLRWADAETAARRAQAGVK